MNRDIKNLPVPSEIYVQGVGFLLPVNILAPFSSDTMGGVWGKVADLAVSDGTEQHLIMPYHYPTPLSWWLYYQPLSCPYTPETCLYPAPTPLTGVKPTNMCHIKNDIYFLCTCTMDINSLSCTRNKIYHFNFKFRWIHSVLQHTVSKYTSAINL